MRLKHQTAPQPVCPHCSHVATPEISGRETRHVCTNCKAAGPFSTSPAVAARLFTNRVRLTGWKTGAYRSYSFTEGNA